MNVFFIPVASFFFVKLLVWGFIIIVIIICRDSMSRNQNICQSTAANVPAQECLQNERIFYVYKYIASVSTLFGLRSNISTRPILVRIEFINIDAFNEWLHNHRPIHRRTQDHFVFDYGLLYHDACDLPTKSIETFRATSSDDVLSVEIKPKQGWNICTLPESLLKLMEIDCDVVQNCCRFCAMQYLKVWRNLFIFFVILLMERNQKLNFFFFGDFVNLNRLRGIKWIKSVNIVRWIYFQGKFSKW